MSEQQRYQQCVETKLYKRTTGTFTAWLKAEASKRGYKAHGDYHMQILDRAKLIANDKTAITIPKGVLKAAKAAIAGRRRVNQMFKSSKQPRTDEELKKDERHERCIAVLVEALKILGDQPWRCLEESSALIAGSLNYPALIPKRAGQIGQESDTEEESEFDNGETYADEWESVEDWNSVEEWESIEDWQSVQDWGSSKEVQEEQESFNDTLEHAVQLCSALQEHTNPPHPAIRYKTIIQGFVAIALFFAGNDLVKVLVVVLVLFHLL